MFEGFVKLADAKALDAGAGTSRQHPVLRSGVLWATVSGEMHLPGSDRWARIGLIARTVQVVSKLGGAVISSLADSPVVSNELSRHGVPWLRRVTNPIVHPILQITETAERRRLANQLLAYREGVLSEIIGRYELGDGVPGVASFMTRKLFKWTGLEGWTNAHKAGVATAISHQMAEHLDTAYAELVPDYRRMLQAYDIGPEDWVTLKGAVIEQEGLRYVVPHALELQGDLATAEGRRAARRARDALATRLLSFLSDRLDAGVIQPGARSKAILLQGQGPGTGLGEVLRAVGQFKGFPAEILVRTWGERAAHNEWGKLAVTVLWMTAIGHAINVIRDSLAGLEQPDYENLTLKQGFEVFARALASGGGASIMGDFVFSDTSRYGRGLVATLAGPVPGQLDSLHAIWASAIRGEDTGAKALQFVYHNIPFINVWYLRTAFNYLLLYPMQEYLNPGYLRRMERTKQRETGQTYRLKPSETEPRWPEKLEAPKL
jgi:hypothetical protein